MVVLPDGEKTLRICVTVYTQYRRVIDRQTDRQTDILPQHSPRYAYALYGKNQRQAVKANVSRDLSREIIKPAAAVKIEAKPTLSRNLY